MSLVRKIIYSQPINRIITKGLYPFRKVLPSSVKIPVVGALQVKVTTEQSIIMNTNQTNFLTKDVFWNGIEGYEYPIIKLFIELAKNSECFFDIGANIGYFSLIAAKVNPNIKCHAFEPMPAAFKFLEMNVKSNDLTQQIICSKVAVTDTSCDLKFHVTKNPKAYWLEDHIGGSSSSAKAKDQHSQTIEVKGQSIDEYIDLQQSELKIDLVKIDTEATEDLVLKGAQKMLACRPLIFCEVLPNRIEKEIQDIFDSHNYVYFDPQLKGLKSVSNIVQDPAKDYLFVPAEKVNEIEQFIIG